MRKALLFIVLFLMPVAVSASDFSGSEIVIPIAARWPGAVGSEWRTDLLVTNAETRSVAPAQTVYIFLSGNGTPEPMTSVTLNPLETITLKDVIGRAFGRASGGGMLRLVATSPTARISARARIYNTASPLGEYGQTVQALPVGKLAMKALLPGLSGVGVNRTNIGIANPSTSPAAVFISLFERSGEFRGGFSIEVAPRSVRVMNDIFSSFQAGPLDEALIRISSSVGVYSYASVVRADTGDADFITATATELDPGTPVITPACSNPAPLTLAPVPAQGWIVLFHSGTDAAAVTAQLAAKYGFTPLNIYTAALQAFHAELTQAQIAALRCEAAVRSIEQNQQVPLP